MKYFYKFRRVLCLLLALLMLMPGNLSNIVHADPEIDVNNRPLTSESEIITTNNDIESSQSLSTPQTQSTITSDGFQLNIEWADGEFKNGTSYDIVEDESISNDVKLRVSYANNQSSETGYKAGSLIITVKGVGKLIRNGLKEAQVGANRTTDTIKDREWTYSYNSIKDTYTFTNNKDIPANTVLSGYFDMSWTFPSRRTIHNYEQNDIVAELITPSGEVITTEPLSLTNKTMCDTYSIDIQKQPLYNANGVSGDIENIDDYIFIKYSFISKINHKSRSVINEKETFIFDSDVTDVGEGGIVTYSSVDYINNQNGLYSLSLKNGLNHDQYAVVAYPRETYLSKQTTASITSSGSFYEGDNNGNFEVVELATDSIDFAMPADFDFFTPPSGIFDLLKESEYEKMEATDYDFYQKVVDNGGHMQGKKVLLGTTENFFLGVTRIAPVENNDKWSFEIVDDFLYIAQNNGNYRQLTKDDYEMTKVTLLSTDNIYNENSRPIKSGVYPVKIYALKEGNVFYKDPNNLNDFYNDENNLVWEGLWENFEQEISLPEGTTSVLIRVENLTEALYFSSNTSSLEEVQEPVAKISIKFHLKEDHLPYEEQTNTSEGKLVNTSLVNFYDKNKNLYNFDNSTNFYDDEEINLDLRQIDIDAYGRLQDRDKGTITFYDGIKNDYSSFTSLEDLKEIDSKKYSSILTIGGDFDYAEEETPDKFSIYTILPKHVSFENYIIEEDIWNVLSFSGMNLSEEELAKHCTVEVNKNYRNSNQIYLALHFDFSDIDVPQDTSIRIQMPIKINTRFFKENGSILVTFSILKIDENIDCVETGKVLDDAKSFSFANSHLASDIDNNNITNEKVAYTSAFRGATYVDSSELQITKSVKTANIDDYVQLPDVPATEFNSFYTYQLSIKNGNNFSNNLIVTDILEARPNTKWKGVFDSIDLSDANKLNMNYEIYYSENQNPSSLYNDQHVLNNDWKIYDANNTDKTKIKAIAIDFGDSLLDIGAQLNININMKAPSDESFKGQITENNFNATFTLLSINGNETITTFTSLDSNFVQVKLFSSLKNLIITKVDEIDNSPLSEAKFSLIKKSTGEIISSKMTNAKGQITFLNIPSDETYILKEIEPPYGYEAKEDMEIEFDENSTLRLTVTNKRKNGTIVIYKKNNLDNLVEVGDAEYTLYTKNGEIIQTATTNINGKTMFENLEWGDYYIQETSCPEGYIIDTNKYEVSINRENVSEIQVLNLLNTQDTSNIVILNKYVETVNGIQTEEPSIGAVFNLYRITKGQFTNLGTFVTDKDGEIVFEGLAYGEYLLKETVAPIGYEKTNDIYFTISVKDEIKNLIAYDKQKPGNIYLFKKDNLENIITGAVFELYDNTKTNVLGSYTTNNGSINIPDLSWGTYYLKEKSTLPYYQLNEEWIEVNINKNNLTINLNCINETKKGTVILTKTDEIGYPIVSSPATFTLYNADGTIIQDNLTTNNEGKLIVENLEWGNYYFKETKAPVGYSLTDETIRFAVNSMNAGITQEIIVTNPAKSNTITITKKIIANDINHANGDPTFLFKITGTDINNKEHTYYRIIRFDNNYVSLNVDENGMVSQSVTISNLISGTYTVIEENSSRYSIDKLETTSNNTTINGETAIIDLRNTDSGDVIFTNNKYEHGGFSHNQSLANVIKVSTKLTAIKATWKGDIVEAGSEIDRNLIEVIALYDDGSFKTLSSNDWFFAESFNGTTFPNVNGVYFIPVSYSENNITCTTNFEVEIMGASDIVVVGVEAKVVEGIVFEANDWISGEYFKVALVYSNGEREPLNYWEPAEDFVFSVEQIPETEDFFTLTISLNPQKYSEIFATTIIVPIEKKVSFLDSYAFKNNMPTSITSVVFTDETAPSTATTIDVSQEGDNSIVAWQEGSVWKVSTQIKDQKVNLSQYPSYMFENKTQLTNIDFTYLNTSYTQDFSSFFYGCTNLTNLDLSGFDTHNATGFYGMFNGCSNLKTVDLSSFNFSKSTNISRMFYNCSSLENIDLSNFDVTNVRNMSYMFYNCKKLTTLDLSSFEKSEVTDMTYMFYGCTSLKELNLENFETPGLTSSLKYTFYNCSNLEKINLGKFNNQNVSSSENIALNTYYKLKEITVSDDFIFSPLSNMVLPEPYAGYWINVQTGEKYKAVDMPNKTAATYTSIDSNLNNVLTSSLTSYITPNSSYAKNIIFTDIKVPEGAITMDVSAAQDGSVLAWIENSSSTFYITSNNPGTKVIANPISKGLFKDCQQITSVDFTNLDTSNVTDMAYMFYNCRRISTINFTNFDTSKVTDMSYMFYYCYNAKTFDLSNFNTENVTNMAYMFYYCSGLTSLNVNHFNTENVTNMSYMFYRCYGLKSLDLSNFNTSNVTDMAYMFYQCYGFASLDLSNFNTENVTNMAYMFYYCYGLTSLNVNSFNTENVTSMAHMFDYCYRLTTLNLSNFYTPKVTSMTYMFYNCYGLTSLNVSNISGESIPDTSYMFYGCYGLTSLDLNNLTYTNNTYNMFYNCNKLKTLNIDNLDVKYSTSFTSMFEDCSSLEYIDVSDWDVSNATQLYKVFTDCSSLKSLDVSNWNTENAINMGYIFYGCSLLEVIDVSNWNTENVTSMAGMFNRCTSLKQIDVSNFKTSNVNNMGAMFMYCSSLTELDISSLDMPNNVSRNFLTNCYNLSKLIVGKDVYYLKIGDVISNPSSDYISGATGKWYNIETGQVSSSLTSLSEGTWVAVPTVLEQTLKKDWQYIVQYNQEIKNLVFTNATRPSSASQADLSALGNKSVVGWQIGDTYYISTQSEEKIKLLPNIDEMFKDLGYLEYIDLTNLDSSNVNSMKNIFDNCISLTKITTGESFNFIDQDKGPVAGANYLWKSESTGQEYLLKDFPSNTADTYILNRKASNILMNGQDFANTIPENITDIIFTNISPKENVTITDVSSAQDNGIVAWQDGKTYYVSTQDPTPIIANSNSNYLFSPNNKELTIKFIDFTNFDTSNISNMQNMFENCNNLEKVITGTSFSLLNSGVQIILPSPTGYWYSESGYTYQENAVPNNEYQIYESSYKRVTFSTKLSGNIPEEITKIVFTDVKAPSNVTLTRYSSYVNGWQEGTTWYISSQTKGQKIYIDYMSEMFSGLSNLQSVDFSNADTSQCSYMDKAFYGCYALQSVDLSNLDTSNVVDMSEMFKFCDGLTSLDLSKLDTSSVRTMYEMFAYCSALTSLNLNNLNTSNVEDMSGLFYACNSLPEINLSSFNTSNVTDMGGMFCYCYSLKSIDVSHFNTSNVASMGSMFSGCWLLEELDLSNFDTSNVTNMGGMFYDCANLTKINMSNFDTSNVTDMSSMFSGMNCITKLDLTNFNTVKVTTMNSMFRNSYNLKEIDLSSFEIIDGANTAEMFYYCSSLRKITLGEKFKFICTSYNSIKLSYFPTPDPFYINNADGLWYNTSGQAFKPEEIPSNVADTYSAIKK